MMTESRFRGARNTLKGSGLFRNISLVSRDPVLNRLTTLIPDNVPLFQNDSMPDLSDLLA